jgi:RHS repeat-associated protein
MVHKLKKYVLTLTAFIIAAGAYAQNRADSVSSNYADLNGAATVKTLLIGFDRCSGLSYGYNSVKLYHYLFLGNDYKYGSAANSATVTLKIDIYSTASGTSGLMQSFTNNVIAINQDAPEKEFIQDITSLVKAGAIRAVMTASAFSCSVPYQSRIKLTSFYKEDVGVDVRNKSVTTGTPTIKNPVKFIWSRNATQQCIPNFQLQVLRLFNRDSTKSVSEIQLKDTVRWDKAVTIETGSPDTTLLLTLAEGRGFYAWRVRPVGTAFPGGAANWRNWGAWNSAALTEGAEVNFTANPYSVNILFFYYQFDNDKNWIYNRTFSEGDPMNTKVRMSETMTFANGLDQVKQQQVKQQSTNRVLANQTIYDYSGRAALNTLSAPVDSVPPIGGDTLGYFKGFIKVGSTLYTAQYFDDYATATNPTAATTGPLIDYYSNSNSDKFVPNAEGYPYSRTVYQKDGTGRVKELGSPAETGRIKSTNDHTFKALYTGVSDQELIRVFGDEAPEGKSVYKTLNIDPNKTVSVSYTSKEGRVIATALSIGLDSTGTTLDTVPGYKKARIAINDTVWGNTPFGKFGITSSKPLAFGVTTKVAFKYVLREKDIKQLCMNYCSTCDYTIQFLLHSEDTTLIIRNKLIPAASCTIPPTKWQWDTTLTLNAGQKYIFEKRIFANNTKPGTSPAKTYLDLSIDSVRNTLDRTASDSLKLVYGFLKRNSMDSLYRYLNHGVFLDFTGNADSIYAGKTFVKSIGCVTIKIPITFCKKETCPGNFEKYFNDYWKGKVYADDPATAYLDNFVPPYGQTTYRFQKGQFNYLIKNMLADGYDCQKLWKCWKQVTLNYKNLKQLSDTTTTGYKFDLMEEFMRCAGRKFAGYSNTDTSKFLGQAYKYFYKPSSTTDCDNLMTSTYGTLTGWPQDSMVAVNTLNKKWENYYNCTRTVNTSITTTIDLSHNAAEGGCKDACNSRYGAFKQSVINMYHNDSVYIEGDKFKLRKDTIWGQIYSFNTDTLTSIPPAANYRSMSSVECLAHTLVESCISNCTLTVYDTLGGKKSGTTAQLEAVKRAMTWGFELKRTTGSCGSEWTRIKGGSGLDTTLYTLWDKHYGSNGITEFRAIKKVIGGYILMGYTNGGSSYDVTDAPRGNYDIWVVRIDDEGQILWNKLIGGSGEDGYSTFARSGNIIQTTDGGFLVGTSSTSGISGDKTSASKGGYDYWIIKLSSSGVIQWQKAYGGTGADYLGSVFQTKDGKYILAGTSYSDAGGDKTDNRIGAGGNFWLIKLNEIGSKIWDKTIGSSSTDLLSQAIESNDGNYVLFGSSSGGISGNKSEANHGLAGDLDYWVIKVDKAGVKIWDRTFGTSITENTGGLVEDKDGNFVLSGISFANIDGDKSENSYGNSDLWLVKINSSGIKIWDKTFGGSGSDGGPYAKIINTPEDGYAIITSSNSNRGGTKSQNSFGSNDYWVLKIDKNGNKRFDRIYGGSAAESSDGMEKDGNGAYVLVGGSVSNISGNKTQNNYPPNYSDGWVVKAEENCTHDSVCFRWVNTPVNYHGDSATVEFKYLTCDSANSTYVYNNILLQVQKYIDSSLTDYRNQYIITCANPDIIKDTLSLSYVQGFYNYTLYYYDRAGNLVRTVPPNGVNYKDVSNNLVMSRLQHNAHTFVTKYWYNSLKQLVKQQTPDGGLSYFWYDYKGELRVSQNAKQKPLNKYSYTKYDNLGRIIEVGESSDSSATFYKVWNLNTPTFPVNNNKERTYTVYTTAAGNISYINNKSQRYLQNRVSYSYTDDNVYTYYSYDPHGNVEWLIQDMPGLEKSYVRYEYDLISNKVLAVHYNETGADEFHHRYTYDTDQRLLTAQTAWGAGTISSSGTLQPQPAVVKQNNVGWDTDAKYKYYLHGPLKRTEIGEDHIQGMDYVYTINGWLKGINYPTLYIADDPGGDKNTTFAKDAFGMVLGYHDNDFKRTGSKFNPSSGGLVNYAATSASTGPGTNLYNGNISSWTLKTGDTTSNSGLMGFKYKYDQLNRIKTEDYQAYVTGTWTNLTTYDNTITYDGNGNILTLNRQGNTTTMDDLSYLYKAGTNKLDHVDDNVAAGTYTTDIDDQNAGNYSYDSIGNITSNVKDSINVINWTAYGKIKSIRKTNGDSLIFVYDASENRIMKTVKPASGNPTITYYVKDASGNVLSVYNRTTVGLNYEYRQKEATIFGSTRLGIRTPDLLIKAVRTDGSSSSCLSCIPYYWIIDVQHANGYYTRELTKKVYELSDHLGNARVTVSDRKNTDSTAVLYSYDNFYAFGSEMPGKSYLSNKYRYGFNGKEKDDEVKWVSGSQYDFGSRIYDSRLGSFLSIDPREAEYSWQSSYSYFGNSPIAQLDYNGEGDYYDKDGKYLASDGKMIKNKKGVDVPDNKAYVTTQEILNNATCEGKTDWDEVGGMKGTILLKYTNSELLEGAAQAVSEGESGFKARAAVVHSLINRANDNSWTFDEAENSVAGSAGNIGSTHAKRMKVGGSSDRAVFRGYYLFFKAGNTGRNNSTDYMGAIAAAIDAMTGGFDYSNGATGWKGKDFFRELNYYGGVAGCPSYDNCWKDRVIWYQKGFKWDSKAVITAPKAAKQIRDQIGSETNGFHYKGTAFFGNNIFLKE